MSANDSPGKSGWGGKVGKVLFWSFSLTVLALPVGGLAYTLYLEWRLPEISRARIAEIRVVFDQAIADGTAPVSAKGIYTISGGRGGAYRIRFPLPEGGVGGYYVTRDLKGDWVFRQRGGTNTFVRDRLRAE